MTFKTPGTIEAPSGIIRGVIWCRATLTELPPENFWRRYKPNGIAFITADRKLFWFPIGTPLKLLGV